MRWSMALILLLVCSVALTSGCGAAMATVGGQVNVDGNPLEDGVIAFVPVDGESAPVQTAVQQGKYELQLTPGPKRVQISAPKVIGKRKEYNGPDAPMVEITDESLPGQYNSSTELTFDVQPGANTKDWNLQTDKPQP